MKVTQTRYSIRNIDTGIPVSVHFSVVPDLECRVYEIRNCVHFDYNEMWTAPSRELAQAVLDNPHSEWTYADYETPQHNLNNDKRAPDCYEVCVVETITTIGSI